MKHHSDDLDQDHKLGHSIKVTSSLDRGLEIVTVLETIHCVLKNYIENLDKTSSTISEHNRYYKILNSHLHN